MGAYLDSTELFEMLPTRRGCLEGHVKNRGKKSTAKSNDKTALVVNAGPVYAGACVPQAAAAFAV